MIQTICNVYLAVENGNLRRFLIVPKDSSSTMAGVQNQQTGEHGRGGQGGNYANYKLVPITLAKWDSHSCQTSAGVPTCRAAEQLSTFRQTHVRPQAKAATLPPPVLSK